MLNWTYELRNKKTRKNVNKTKRWYRKEPFGEFWERRETECAQQKKNIKEPKRLTNYTKGTVHAFLLELLTVYKLR